MTMSGASAGLGEGLVDARAAGEALVVGDDRILGDGLERQRLDALERVAGRDDDAVMPRVVRERHDVRVLLQRLGGNADVGAAVEQHGDDLLRARLVQHEMDVRERLLGT